MAQSAEPVTTMWEVQVPEGIAPGQAFQASVGGLLMVRHSSFFCCVRPWEFLNCTKASCMSSGVRREELTGLRLPPPLVSYCAAHHLPRGRRSRSADPGGGAKPTNADSKWSSGVESRSCRRCGGRNAGGWNAATDDLRRRGDDAS